jgi:hypothetical protein
MLSKKEAKQAYDKRRYQANKAGICLRVLAYQKNPRRPARVQAKRWLHQANKERRGCTSSLEEATWWFENKASICQCCKKKPAKCLDHKHGGPIRGWVCHGCNILIGRIETPPSGQRLADAEMYLNSLDIRRKGCSITE